MISAPPGGLRALRDVARSHDDEAARSSASSPGAGSIRRRRGASGVGGFFLDEAWEGFFGVRTLIGTGGREDETDERVLGVPAKGGA